MTNTRNQEIAFDKFSKLKVGALFMKMGTGKTKVALELVNYNKVELLIYVCPYSTKSNIENEVLKWGIDCDYIVVGYESVQSSSRVFLEVLEMAKDKRCFIIADESIFIKNEETKRFDRLIKLRQLCDYALILNGTPITKNEWDLFNQMYFLSPRIINMTRQEFLETFFTKITYKKKNHNEHTFYKFSEVNAKLLKKMIEPYMFECDLDLDIREEDKFVWVDCEKTFYIKEKEERLKEYQETGKADAIINMLTSLNVISANCKEKNDKLIEYIKDKKVIAFCNFLSEVEYISKNLDCFVITGNTKNRNEIIENFKNSQKPLIMTLGVGSYSLNLQFCNEIVYSSLCFDYAKVEQSMFRIKRMGQEKDIKYTYFLSNFGINRLILDNLRKKQTLEEIIKNNLKGDLKWIKSL